ncbi:hypothetical protein JKA74_12525 [Marivirga sp. S37H4]|uniref:Uncharacterized protein n=1 Tax=Marivirga aurantiaca TaxID=2802615 RepID=A0A934WZY7_9BACT|nr:hypothetical protein [Marivirga aurantiaca]MBK6265861.1 hypothetical protein [Marivirga aurantiaca]
MELIQNNMKKSILSLAIFFAATSLVFAEDKGLKKEAKLINEVIESMELNGLYFEEINLKKTIKVYTVDGTLLHSFSEENFDAKAIRNADFIMEDESSKIFIKL